MSRETIVNGSSWSILFQASWNHIFFLPSFLNLLNSSFLSLSPLSPSPVRVSLSDSVSPRLIPAFPFLQREKGNQEFHLIYLCPFCLSGQVAAAPKENKVSDWLANYLTASGLLQDILSCHYPLVVYSHVKTTTPFIHSWYVYLTNVTSQTANDFFIQTIDHSWSHDGEFIQTWLPEYKHSPTVSLTLYRWETVLDCPQGKMEHSLTIYSISAFQPIILHKVLVYNRMHLKWCWNTNYFCSFTDIFFRLPFLRAHWSI